MNDAPKEHPAAPDDLLPLELCRVLPARDSAGLVLSGGGKRFIIFIGPTEAAAVLRELKKEQPARPLTHDLLAWILAGYDIQVESVVISSVVNGAFCSTLTLVRKVGAEEDRVRLDARASDAIVLALRHGVALQVTRRVIDEVEDVSKMLAELEEQIEKQAQSGEGDEPGASGEAGGESTPPLL